MSGREAFEAWTALPVRIGELVALVEGGLTPMVMEVGQPESHVVRARSVVDLHAGHVGQQVVLMFEAGDPARPIVMGVLREHGQRPQELAVEADGERVVVSARQQLVLRCGAASITLTRAGKVLIEGAYVLSKSAGVNRIKGGSVQLN